MLHIIRMNDRPKTIKDLARLTNRDDVPNIQYSLRKLIGAALVIRKGSGRSGVTYEVTKEGRPRGRRVRRSASTAVDRGDPWRPGLRRQARGGFANAESTERHLRGGVARRRHAPQAPGIEERSRRPLSSGSVWPRMNRRNVRWKTVLNRRAFLAAQRRHRVFVPGGRLRETCDAHPGAATAAAIQPPLCGRGRLCGCPRRASGRRREDCRLQSLPGRAAEWSAVPATS